MAQVASAVHSTNRICAISASAGATDSADDRRLLMLDQVNNVAVVP